MARPPGDAGDDGSGGIIVLLDRYRREIGAGPAFLVTLALVLLFIRSRMPEGDAGISGFMSFLAGCLAVLAVTIAMLRMISPYFSRRPPRGLFDGQVAGAIAGLVGGALGYGWHTEYVLADGQAMLHTRTWYERVAICLLFATCIGGIMGVLIDFVHPTAALRWRRHLTMLLGTIIVLVLACGVGVFVAAPTTDGAGIILSDIQWLFEVYLITIAVTVPWSLGWSGWRILARMPVLIVAIAVARAPTFVLIGQEGVLLAYRRFLYYTEPPGAGMERLLPAVDATFAAELGLTVVVLIVWVCVSYAVYYRDHRITRWLDRRFGASPGAASRGAA